MPYGIVPHYYLRWGRKPSSTLSKSSHIVGSILPWIKCKSLGFISIRPNGLSLVPCAHHLYSRPYAFVISWLCDTKGKKYSTGIETNRDANVSQCLLPSYKTLVLWCTQANTSMQQKNASESGGMDKPSRQDVNLDWHKRKTLLNVWDIRVMHDSPSSPTDMYNTGYSTDKVQWTMWHNTWLIQMSTWMYTQ